MTTPYNRVGRIAIWEVSPEDFAERIAKSAGLHNILVHDYNDLNREVVHASIQSYLEDYHTYIEYLRAFVERSCDGQQPFSWCGTRSDPLPLLEKYCPSRPKGTKTCSPHPP